MEPARKFKIIVNSKECGTCSGATPSAVAKKVVKKLCGTSSKAVKFILKECKRGCERVCGPYQGRMEKLDKPYKRDGKKITHRVVCGKIRKMRGGRELVAEDFEKSEGDGDFRIDKLKFKLIPHIFFGEISYDGKKYYRYLIFNNERFGNNKSVSIFKILRGEVILVTKFYKISEYEEREETKNKINKIFIDFFNKYEDNLKIGLIKLKKYLNEKFGYNTIKEYLNLLCSDKKVNDYQNNSKKVSEMNNNIKQQQTTTNNNGNNNNGNNNGNRNNGNNGNE